MKRVRPVDFDLCDDDNVIEAKRTARCIMVMDAATCAWFTWISSACLFGNYWGGMLTVNYRMELARLCSTFPEADFMGAPTTFGINLFRDTFYFNYVEKVSSVEYFHYNYCMRLCIYE